MTQRSIVAGLTPMIIIRAGADITVEGWDSDRVLAETPGRSGLKVGRRSEGEFGRLRAAVGERGRGSAGGGRGEGRIGAGRVTLRLKAGGDVTLVTHQVVTPHGPDFVMGRIERPVE